MLSYNILGIVTQRENRHPPPQKRCRPKKSEYFFYPKTSVAYMIENVLRTSNLSSVFSTTLGSGYMAKKRTKPNLT